MFATIKQVLNPRNKTLQKRILFMLTCLFIFELGTTIVVPIISRSDLLGDLGFLELINVMGGGALSRFSIFALGVSPYITASIIIQLLQMDIVPYLSELSKQGQTGRNKINQITRIAGIGLALVQGYFFSFAVLQNGSVLQCLEIAVIMTAGTSLVLWIGDQITSKGVGNGISLIIMAGIISTMPSMFKDVWDTLIVSSTAQTLALGITKFSIFVIIYIVVILGIVFMQLSERRIPIQYANKSTGAYGGSQNYIPFKLNSAGVIPVIFASALLSIPSILSQFIKNAGFQLFVSKYLTTSSVTGFIIYIIAIFAFAYFYTFLQIKPEEMADNLNKNGGYIPGIRPGDETVSYIKKVLSRITLVGATALAFIAALPIAFALVPGFPSSASIGGTGMIIVVGVALETYKQIESESAQREYVKRGRHR